MRKIRIDFCDFWDGFSKTDNWFMRQLRQRFEVEICDRPEFLFYAQPRLYQHRVANCYKIYFGVESDPPDWSECDFALTCHYMNDPRQFRLPLYAIATSPARLTAARLDPERALAAKTGFCSFVVSNRGRRGTFRRIEFFKKLSKYKRVDSGGRLLNNIGRRLPDGFSAKMEFLARFKFNIAFENKSLPGYTTEKLVEAIEAKTLPIYWGNPRIQEDFNTRSFLNADDFESDDALIDRILELDSDDARYLEVMKQPVFVDQASNPHFEAEPFLNFMETVFNARTPPVSSRRKWYQIGRWRLVKQDKPRLSH